MKSQEIIICNAGGYVDWKRNQPSFNKPDEKGQVIKSMMGMYNENDDKPVINEDRLSVEARMIYNMIPGFRQEKEKAKSEAKSDEHNNSEEEIKAMLMI